MPRSGTAVGGAIRLSTVTEAPVAQQVRFAEYLQVSRGKVYRIAKLPRCPFWQEGSRGSIGSPVINFSIGLKCARMARSKSQPYGVMRIRHTQSTNRPKWEFPFWPKALRHKAFTCLIGGRRQGKKQVREQFTHGTGE
jgi:hypothetical protein